MECDDRHPGGEGPDAAQHSSQRQFAAAEADVPRHPVRARHVRTSVAQRDHCCVCRRERQHRAEAVEVAEEVGLAWDQQQHGEAGKDDQREPRRPVFRMHARKDLRQLAVLCERPGQSRNADHAGVRGDHQNRCRQHADVVAQRGRDPVT